METQRWSKRFRDDLAWARGNAGSDRCAHPRSPRGLVLFRVGGDEEVVTSGCARYAALPSFRECTFRLSEQLTLKRIAILGSTGSIGRQTLAVVEAMPERFGVAALSAGNNIEDDVAAQIAHATIPNWCPWLRPDAGCGPRRKTSRSGRGRNCPEIPARAQRACDCRCHASRHLHACIRGDWCCRP